MSNYGSPKPKIVMGVDPSYRSTGIVILEDDWLVHAEVYKTDTTYNNFIRAHTISNYLYNVAKEWEADHIMVEGLAYAARGDVTREMAGLLFAIIIKLYVQNHFHLTEVAPKTIKKFGAGYGFAKKEDMINALPNDVREYFESIGVKKTTGLADLADAYWVAQIHHQEFA